MIKTKIVATLGPSSNDPHAIKALMDVGVDVFRLNFSHGTLDEHAELLQTLNHARAQHSRTVAVMGDLCGPKIRTSPVDPEGTVLQEDDEIIVSPQIDIGQPHHFGTNYEHFCQDVHVGHRVLIDDGQIALRVTEEKPEQTVCQVLVGGPLHSRKGINLPDSTVSIPCITERDWECVDWAIKHKLDFLALSFVRSAAEVVELKEHLRTNGSNIKVVSKIEKPQAIEHLDSIVTASDAVLVARGDLGVEMDLAEVPLIQKRITHLCRQLGKPVIVATQMLQSMIDAPVPTRAEVSDVANAIMDFTDAVMLSGETAVGKYPLEAVRTITRIAQFTEAYLDESSAHRPKVTIPEELALIAALTRSVAQIIDETDAKLVVAWSHTGLAARLLSKARVDVPIIVFTPSKLTCRQMCLHYGVMPFCRPAPEDIKELAEIAEKIIYENDWAAPGDQTVLLAGRPLTAPGTNNAIMIHNLSETQPLI